jgi:hypothetical protein
MAEAGTLYILLGIIILQAILNIAMYVFFRKEARQLDVKEKDESKIISGLIDSGSRKAEEIVHNAVDKAEEIVYHSNIFKNQLEHEVHAVFQEAVSRQKAMFDTLLNTIHEDYKGTFAQTKQNVESEMQKSVETFRALAQKELETFKSQSQQSEHIAEDYLKQQMETELAKAKQEIEQFKAVEMKRIEDTVRQNVNRITRDVLRMSIPAEQHEKLIVAALERAKQENFFTV